MKQLDLQISAKAPEVTPEQVGRLCEILKGRGWVFAKELKAEYGIDDRSLRAIANHSDGRIISGQRGYRLLDRSVSVEEVDHAATWLESQGKQMIKRGSAIRRRYHKYAR